MRQGQPQQRSAVPAFHPGDLFLDPSRCIILTALVVIFRQLLQSRRILRDASLQPTPRLIRLAHAEVVLQQLNQFPPLTSLVLGLSAGGDLLLEIDRALQVAHFHGRSTQLIQRKRCVR